MPSPVLKGVKFTALMTGRQDGQFKGDPATSIAETFENQGALKKKLALEFAGMSGLEMRVEGQGSGALIRVFKTKDTVYQLIVEAFPPTRLEEVEGDARRFFESLKTPQQERD
ncbi:MAG TPA: hypothetical protein VEL76_15080 [Gemmataceae bacterium]|nr:hypothetical protein [Gemmataceae bacterium]